MAFRILAACALGAVAIGAAGCAAAPAQPVAATAGQDCRSVVLPGETRPVNMCGTAEQWAEYEQRVAVFQPGISCRELLGARSNTVSTRCGTEEFWEAYDREEAAVGERQAQRFQGSQYNQ